MLVKHKRRFISLKVKKLSFFGKFSGLMFKGKETDNLLFVFDKDTRTPIHSYFVFFSFLAVWLDKNNNALECQIVKPFASVVKPEKKFRKLVELPLNSKNIEIIKFFVGKGKI